MMDHGILNNSLLLLALSVLLVWVSKFIRLPSILGYLFVGILIGPYTLNLLPEHTPLAILAEVGLVFLLFMIGLEFSGERLLSMRGEALKLGPIQVTISTLSGMFIIYMSGASWEAALVAGGSLALSSTAIVAKQLAEQFELQERHGRLGIATLLFQDLMAIPLLVIIPILADESRQLQLSELAIALIKGGIAFFLLYFLGKRLLRPFLHLVAAVNSLELFTLATLLIALAAAWLTSQFGLSFALGAFLAGIMLSETEYRHQIETDIRPFRDVMMGLFFISVGTQFNWTILLTDWAWVGLLTAGLIIGKGVVVTILTRIVGYDWQVAIRTGIVLGQGGEFAFAVLFVALNHGLMEGAQIQSVIASVILSMILSPILIRFNSPLTEWLFRGSISTTHLQQSLDEVGPELKDHVVICGYGRIGQNLALFLRDRKIPHVALELNHSLVKEAWEAGEKVFYGDSTQWHILKKTVPEKAKVMVVTFDNPQISSRIISAIRNISDELPIIVRSHSDDHMDELRDAGANSIIPESFEASMMLAKHVLERFDMTSQEAKEFVEKARDNEYRRLRSVFAREELDDDMTKTYSFLLHTVIINSGDFAEEKVMADLDFSKIGVQVLGVRIGKERIIPTAETQLKAGYALVLQGPGIKLDDAEDYIMWGDANV